MILLEIAVAGGKGGGSFRFGSTGEGTTWLIWFCKETGPLPAAWSLSCSYSIIFSCAFVSFLRKSQICVS